MQENHPLRRAAGTGVRFTGDPELDDLLERLLDGLRQVFGSCLMGLYCYGSLVWGGFDRSLSDIDLAAVLERDVSAEEFSALERLHTALAKEFPRWEDRIEVQYVGKETLAHFRHGNGRMANISPGEPLHPVPCTAGWLTNWYFAREYGHVLAGIPREEAFPEISHPEFLEAVRFSALEWPERIEQIRDSCSYQGYAVLTLCRACYTLVTGRQASKAESAGWLAERWPEAAQITADALRWREERDKGPHDPARTLPRTEAFIRAVVEKIRTGSHRN